MADPMLPDAPPAVDAPRGWGRSDTIALTVVTVLAGIIRLGRITTPPFIFSDENFYAREACNIAFASPASCGVPLDAVTEHPPLGKLLIALGIRAAGFTPLGWRLPEAIAGTITVALLFLLARKLGLGTRAASFCAGLLAIDFLHVVQSRMATLDVFLTMFVVASVLAVAIDRDDLTGRTLRPWLLLAGAAGGAATATKWVGVTGLAFAGALALYWNLRRAPLRRLIVPFGFAFAVVPAFAYTATFAGRTDGSLVAAPWLQGSWVRNFAHVQRGMLEFHKADPEIKYVGLTNPYASPAWSWPLLKRPMTYYAEPDTGPVQQRITATGSPFVWWTCFAALGFLAVCVVQRKADDAARVAVGGFLAMYAPLVLVSSGRAATFIYYMLPSVPFMCLAIVAVTRRARWQLLAAYGLIAVVSFAFFYPVLTGVSLPRGAVERRIWFHDCAPATGRKAPSGWCWE
ncbi:MAG TPA: phospholipid carrier-dependent glycosyltransferase [Gemmatimonadaceae bacterium]|nr:phospholipid carrier-dependent glycosyltransferase [Gemmatimonadaceae bacterium]